MDLSKRSIKTNRRNLVTYFSPNSMYAEEFRTVKTNVQIVSEQLQSRVLLVTSPGSGEGKSTVAANLAVSMAKNKEKVLLIDTNLRNPNAHYIFNIINTVGLTDVLIGNARLEDAVTPTDIGNLNVLTSGSNQSNPTELLNSYMMENILQKAAQQYDTVLVDAPSVLGVAGTNLLASLCEGVLLVVRQGKTKVESVEEVKKILEFSNAKIAGIILNEM